MEAIGILEIYGLTAALVAGDAAAKAARVTIEAIDTNRPKNSDIPIPLVVVLKIKGSISDVEVALEAGQKAAKKVSDVIVKHIIPRPYEDTNLIIKINRIGKNKII